MQSLVKKDIDYILEHLKYNLRFVNDTMSSINVNPNCFK